MIKFCPKCKSIMMPKKDDGGKVVMRCSCGYSEAAGEQTALKEEKIVKKEEAEMDVVDEDFETLPVTKEECPECGNKEAYYWLVQTRAADEAATKFLKCTKCKHIWRDYS